MNRLAQMRREGSMKMGRLLVVLLLVVVGVAACKAGCKDRSEETGKGLPKSSRATSEETSKEKTSKALLQPSEVSKVDRWQPSGTGVNPTIAVEQGQTVFVFDKKRKMRARLHIMETR